MCVQLPKVITMCNYCFLKYFDGYTFFLKLCNLAVNMSVFSHSTNTCWPPGTILCTGDIAVSEKSKGPTSRAYHVGGGGCKICCKQTYNLMSPGSSNRCGKAKTKNRSRK